MLLNNIVSPNTHDSGRDGSRLSFEISNRVLSLVFILVGITAPIFWMLSSYFKIDIAASLIFRGDDGWCDPATQGLGVHCFGDFSERWLVGNAKDLPWGGNLELSPIGPFITFTANRAATLIAPQVVLGIVVISYALMMLIPAVISSWRYSLTTKFIVLSGFGLLTYPFLAALDRLNNVAFLAPILLLYLVALCKAHYNLVVLSVVLASAVKPQLMLLVIALIAMREWRRSLVAIMGGISTVALLVVAAGKFDLDRIRQYISAIMSYKADFGSSNIETVLTPNISISHAMYQISQYLDPLLIHVTGGRLSPSELIKEHSSLIQIAVLLLVTGVLSVYGAMYGSIYLGSVVICLSCLVLGDYVGAYYLIFAIPIAAVLLKFGNRNPALVREPDHDGEEHSQGLRNSLFKIHDNLQLLTLALSFSLAPIFIPTPDKYFETIVGNGSNQLADLTPVIASAFWLIILLKTMLLPRIHRQNRLCVAIRSQSRTAFPVER